MNKGSRKAVMQMCPQTVAVSRTSLSKAETGNMGVLFRQLKLALLRVWINCRPINKHLHLSLSKISNFCGIMMLTDMLKGMLCLFVCVEGLVKQISVTVHIHVVLESGKM